MKYTYKLTKSELLEFSIRAVGEVYRRQPGAILSWLFSAGLVSMVSRPFMWVVILLFSAVVLLDIYATYIRLKRAGFLEERTLWTEGAFLKGSAGDYGETALHDLEVIRSHRRLLMLGKWVSRKQVQWYVLPVRVFQTQQEKDALLRQISQMRERPAEEREDEIQELSAENTVFRFVFEMDEDKWTAVYARALELIQAGTLGMAGRRKTTLAVYLLFLGIALIGQGLFPSARIMVYAVPVFLMLMAYFLISKKENPGKMAQKQIKSGNVQKDIIGRWEFLLTEEGIMNRLGRRGRSFVPWQRFAWLVEAGDVIYLFQDNKSKFFPIPLDAAGGAEEVEALRAFCSEKGLQYRRAKTYKPISGIACGLSMAGAFAAAVLLVGFMLAWQDGKLGGTSGGLPAAYGESVFREEPFDPADYPDYVPFDQQVRVLRSLGFTVPEELAETMRSRLDNSGNPAAGGPDMRPLIEGWPYTWLLTELGMPEYSEDMEILSWPKEVFWFDFEGWDISADYVDVLNGMKTLAQGSMLDDVENIGEDVSGVNWEEGSGNIWVSFSWRGSRYEYEMTMEYDWIDGEVLGIYNGLLEGSGEERRFFAAGDNGQGALVFFREQAWADKFEKATGIKLDAPITALKVQKQPVIVRAQQQYTHPRS